MKNKIFLCMLLLAGLAACRKQNQLQETPTAEATEIRSLPPVYTPGGPYPSPMEWAFGNALVAGQPCDIAYAMCGVWEPTPPFPLNMNYNTSAPANLAVSSPSDLRADVDGTQLDPAIKQQALAGAPYLIAHNTPLPQSAVQSAYAAAGLPAPTEVILDAGSYETTVEEVAAARTVIKVRFKCSVTVHTAFGTFKATLTVTITFSIP